MAARLLCVGAFAVQILLPALHPVHGGVDAGHGHAHLGGAHAAVTQECDGIPTTPHDAQGCVLCAALAAGHAGLSSAAPAPARCEPVRRFVRAVAAPALPAAPLTRAAPRAPPLLSS